MTIVFSRRFGLLTREGNSIARSFGASVGGSVTLIGRAMVAIAAGAAVLR